MSTVPIAGPRRLAPVSRRYAVAWVYLVCFAAVQVAYALLVPRAQAAFVTWASTSVANLGRDPVGCLVVSAFVTGGGLVARLTNRPFWRGAARQLILGAFAAGITYLIGLAVGGMAAA